MFDGFQSSKNERNLVLVDMFFFVTIHNLTTKHSCWLSFLVTIIFRCSKSIYLYTGMGHAHDESARGSPTCAESSKALSIPLTLSSHV